MQSSPYRRSRVFCVEQLCKFKVTCSYHIRYTTLKRREDLKSRLDEEENSSTELTNLKRFGERGKGKAEKGKDRDVDLECQAGESAVVFHKS